MPSETTTTSAARAAQTVTPRTLADCVGASSTASLAPSTRRSYARRWARWDSWCAATGRVPLPATAETLAAFVAELTEHGTSAPGIRQAVGAVRAAHAAAGYRGRPARP